MSVSYPGTAEEALRRINSRVRVEGGRIDLLATRGRHTTVAYDLLVMITDRMGEPVLFGRVERPWQAGFWMLWHKVQRVFPRPLQGSGGIAQWAVSTPMLPMTPMTPEQQMEAALEYIRRRYPPGH